MTDFQRLFTNIRAHPRMFLLAPSYLALVSFVSGCDTAIGGRLLAGFDHWVSERLTGEAETSLGWPTLVAGASWPPVLDGAHSIAELPPDADLKSTDMLLQLLDEFVVTNNRTQM